MLAARRPQDLVLQFCPELLLGGLLPWHCSVTQYSPMGRLRDVTQRKLLRVRAPPLPRYWAWWP